MIQEEYKFICSLFFVSLIYKKKTLKKALLVTQGLLSETKIM